MLVVLFSALLVVLLLLRSLCLEHAGGHVIARSAPGERSVLWEFDVREVLLPDAHESLVGREAVDDHPLHSPPFAESIIHGFVVWEQPSHQENLVVAIRALLTHLLKCGGHPPFHQPHRFSGAPKNALHGQVSYGQIVVL